MRSRSRAGTRTPSSGAHDRHAGAERRGRHQPTGRSNHEHCEGLPYEIANPALRVTTSDKCSNNPDLAMDHTGPRKLSATKTETRL